MRQKGGIFILYLISEAAQPNRTQNRCDVGEDIRTAEGVSSSSTGHPRSGQTQKINT